MSSHRKINHKVQILTIKETLVYNYLYALIIICGSFLIRYVNQQYLTYTPRATLACNGLTWQSTAPTGENMPVIPLVLLILKPATCYLCRNIKACVVAKVENDIGTHNVHSLFMCPSRFIWLRISSFTFTQQPSVWPLAFYIPIVPKDFRHPGRYSLGSCAPCRTVHNTSITHLTAAYSWLGSQQEPVQSCPVPVRLARSQFDHIC